MYTDEYGLRNADYVKIEDDIVHKDDIKYKLNGDNMDSSTPHKLTLKDLITNSAIPDNYKVSQINDEGKRARSNNSSQRRSKVRNSSASKYSYSKQKEVNQLATGDKVETLKKNKEAQNKPKYQKGFDNYDVSDEEIDGNATHESVKDKVTKLSNMGKQGKK